MHNFGYLGKGEYLCRNCGLKTDKVAISEALSSECAGSPVPAEMQRKVRANREKTDLLAKKLALLADRIDALEGGKTS